MSSRKNGKRKDEISCVQLSKDTKSKLDKLGTKSDTYEKIIVGLMDNTCAKQVSESEVEPDE